MEVQLYKHLILLSILLLLTTPPLHAYPFPRGLANFLFTLKDGPVEPPRLADLSHFRSFSCTHRQDGAYPDLQSSCTAYYRCLGGSVYSYVCPKETAFDRDEQECLPQASVTCPKLPPHTRRCNNQTDGFYPDYSSSCHAYYRCSGGELVGTGRCDRGAIWDFATASCGAGPRASCSPPSCWGLPDGPHPLQGSRCAAYFTCSDGTRTDNVCPIGTSFDYMEKECVSNSRSVCYERVCEGRVNGLHAMPQAPCQAYFRCFNAALVQVEVCPPRHIFDGWECVQAAIFSCWSDSNGSCSERPDGTYAGDDNECRSFFLCRQKRLVRSFRCSPGLVFNGEKCVDSQNYICSSRPRIPDCSNKHDGYYIIDKSNCRSFYYCRDGAKLSEHNCPGNYIFNGEQCGDPLYFSCHSRDFINATHDRRSRLKRELHPCLGQTDGYYLDTTAACNKFYECKDGNEVASHQCPENTIASEGRCIANQNQTCPITLFSESCTPQDNDGLYRDVQDCSSLYKCSAGTKITYKCPPGTSYDGTRCRAAEEVKCADDSVCQNALDGRYAVEGSPCDARYMCRGQDLVQWEACEGEMTGTTGTWAGMKYSL